MQCQARADYICATVLSQSQSRGFELLMKTIPMDQHSQGVKLVRSANLGSKVHLAHSRIVSIRVERTVGLSEEVQRIKSAD